MGSAVDQNKIPVATLVHTVIANQFQRLINGFASAPPILTAPKGDNAITAQAATAKIEQIVNSQPNLTTMKVLIPVTTVLNASPSIKFKLTMRISETNGGQKTQWLSAWYHGLFACWSATNTSARRLKKSVKSL